MSVPATPPATTPPTASASATSELQSSLRELSLANKSPIKDIPRPTPPTSVPKQHHHTVKKKKEPAPVADSWEDEVDSASASDPEGGAADISSTSPATSSRFASPALSPSIRYTEGPLDPPPTPISPQTSASQPPWPAYGGRSEARSPARRPEKQTAVAGRMIAGALGIRAPKRTEEQRAYDRAVKEQEMKRRNKEKEEAAKAKEEEEKAKAAVWDM